MASKETPSDPSSPEPSKESAGPSSISETPTTSETPPTLPSQPDYEKIEIMSSKSSSVVKQLTSGTPSSPTAPIVEPEAKTCCDHIDKIECDATPLNVVIFIFAMSVFVLRAVLYKIGDLYYEVIVLALCIMAGAVLTCVVKRGYYAKVWMPSTPKARVPRPNSAEDIPMEPLVPRKQSLAEVESRQTLEAVVHHEAETESSQEASASTPTSVSSGSDKPVPSTSHATPSDPERKDVKSKGVKTETPKSSPASRAYKYLFKKH